MKKIQKDNKLTVTAKETADGGRPTLSEQFRVVSEITPLSRQSAEVRRY